MKNLLVTLLPTLIFATSPFETPLPKSFNMSMFDTKKTKESREAIKNPKVKCRTVCDKKVYSEQQIGDAVGFYKSSKLHKFKPNR